MSTTSLASRRFLVRPLDGGNQVYEGLAIDATVRDLKERIFVAEGVAIENQKLIYGPEILQDNRTLESYHIREVTTQPLPLPSPISLSGVQQPNPTPSLHPPKAPKEKILILKLTNPQGFVLRLLTVVAPPAPNPAPAPPSPSSATDDNDRVLPTVFVRTANGVNVAMSQVRLRTTVEAFREQYSRRQAQDPEVCRLIFSGKEMQNVLNGNVMTLQDYNVQNESTLHEVFRLPGGFR